MNVIKVTGKLHNLIRILYILYVLHIIIDGLLLPSFYYSEENSSSNEDTYEESRDVGKRKKKSKPQNASLNLFGFYN